MGPHPPKHRVVQRQSGCIGGGLRRGARDPLRRRGRRITCNIESPSSGSRSRETTCGFRKACSPSPRRNSASARRPGSTSSKRGPSSSKRARRSPALEILLGQANDTLCTLVGSPAARPGGRSGTGPAAGQLADPEHARRGSPPASRPTCCADGPTFAAPSARWPRNRLRSASPKPTSTPPSSSTAPSAGMPQNFSQAFSNKSFLGLLIPGLPVEHPQLRPNPEQRAAAGGPACRN